MTWFGIFTKYYIGQINNWIKLSDWINQINNFDDEHTMGDLVGT